MDRERHGVVVPLWYERRAAFWDTQFLGNLGHEKSWGCQTPRKSLVTDNLDITRCQVNETKNLSRYGAFVVARFCRRRTDNNLP